MITLSTARPDDVPAIADLAAEMDRHYGAAELVPIEKRQELVDLALFADPPTAWALLARDEQALIGFASYSFLWPAASMTGSLYLKELYVAQHTRRTHVGAALMRGLAEVAVRLECSRLEWTTDRDNADAIAFYEALGFQPLESKVFYRLDGDTLKTAAGRR